MSCRLPGPISCEYLTILEPSTDMGLITICLITSDIHVCRLVCRINGLTFHFTIVGLHIVHLKWSYCTRQSRYF